MTIVQAFRRLCTPQPTQCCQGCANFCSDAARIEQALPGLATLSSAYASVRAEDGLCLALDRLTNGQRGCAGFTVRPILLGGVAADGDSE